MELVVLGSGNAFNQDLRLNSAYLLKSSVGLSLIDCGFTVSFALQRANVAVNELDCIFITHYHGDHFGGLSALLLALKYTSPQKKKLHIVGPSNVYQKVKDLQSFMYAGTERLLDELDIEFIQVDHSAVKQYIVNKMPFSVIPMIHSDQALPVAYVLGDEYKKIGFSGDTCWHKGVEALVAASDYCIVECNFADKVGEGHISVDELLTSELVKNRRSAIFLTHLNQSSALKAKTNGFQILEDFQILPF